MMRIFTKTFLGLLAAASFTTAQAQWQLNAPNTPYTEDFSTFLGTGFHPNPAPGQLDSDTWKVTGMSSGNLSFGAVGDTADFARGTTSLAVTTGGIYAFDTGTGNIILGVQPVGADFTPGTLMLRIQNTTGAVIKDLNVSYDLFVRNDQPRGNSWNFSYSPDTIAGNFVTVAALSDTTTAAGTAGAPWTFTTVSATLSNVNIAQNAFFYIQWSSNDVAGSGNRDEIGIDNLTLTALPLIFAHFGASMACEDETVMFMDSSMSNNGAIVSWVWSFGDTNTAYVQNPSNVYDAPGTYNVQLVVTNANNDVDTVVMPITVNAKPLAAFTSNNTTGCSPFCAAFSDISTIQGPDMIDTWMWDFGDGNMSTMQNPTNCYANAGMYDVSLIAWSNNGCSDTVMMPGYITVNQSPVASYTQNTAGSIFTGMSTSTGNITNYIWDMGEGTIYTGPGSNNVNHNYPFDGTYNVCLIVLDANGCSDTTCQSVTILTTGAEELTLTDALTIYPNPSSTGIITADFGKYSGKDVKITVYNIIGKAVYERQIISNSLEKQTINLQHLPSGNYFINISDGKETFTRRITINR